MKPIQILENKKVDQDLLAKEFTNFVPTRLDIAIHVNADQKVFDMVNTLDYIDYHYRLYLKWHNKTLHRVFLEFRNLKPQHIKHGLQVIDEVAVIAEQNEFYELLIRHNKAKEKILKQFNNEK